MQKSILAGAAALAAALAFAVNAPTQASVLGKIGKSLTYPVKKAAGNTSKGVNHAGQATAYVAKKDAGNASKGVNTTGQKAAYPVRKAGVNTSKTAHKVTQ